MKARSMVITAVLVCAFTAVAVAQYSIDWYTIDGGGGTSTGGVYTVSGTIGQPDAGRMSGGNYTLEGGFWGIIAAVQTEGSPYLSVSLTPTNAVLISWPTPAANFNLQRTAALGSGSWSAVTNVPVQVGSRWQVIVAPPVGNQFYRLVK